MRGSGTEPLLPLQHAVDPPQLCHLPLQLGGCRWTRGDGGRQGKPPFYLDSKANYGWSNSAWRRGPFYLLRLLRELGCGTMAGEEGRSEMVGERRGLQLTSNLQRLGGKRPRSNTVAPRRGHCRRSSPVLCRHSSPAGPLLPLLAGNQDLHGSSSPPSQEAAVARLGDMR